MLRGITLTEAEETLNPLRKKKEGLPFWKDSKSKTLWMCMQWVRCEEQFLGGKAYGKWMHISIMELNQCIRERDGRVARQETKRFIVWLFRFRPAGHEHIYSAHTLIATEEEADGFAQPLRRLMVRWLGVEVVFFGTAFKTRHVKHMKILNFWQKTMTIEIHPLPFHHPKPIKKTKTQMIHSQWMSLSSGW